MSARTNLVAKIKTNLLFQTTRFFCRTLYNYFNTFFLCSVISLYRHNFINIDLIGISRRKATENLVLVYPWMSSFPTRGWALYDRPPPTRLNPQARAYLVELFEGGKLDKNRRVSPQEAENFLRQKFPTQEDSWLSVKQVRHDVFSTDLMEHCTFVLFFKF